MVAVSGIDRDDNDLILLQGQPAAITFRPFPLFGHDDGYEGCKKALRDWRTARESLVAGHQSPVSYSESPGIEECPRKKDDLAEYFSLRLCPLCYQSRLLSNVVRSKEHSMAEHGEWTRKGATLSDVTAKKEYGISQDFIVKGIQAGKLEYREGAMW